MRLKARLKGDVVFVGGGGRVRGSDRCMISPQPKRSVEPSFCRSSCVNWIQNMHKYNRMAWLCLKVSTSQSVWQVSLFSISLCFTCGLIWYACRY